MRFCLEFLQFPKEIQDRVHEDHQQELKDNQQHCTQEQGLSSSHTVLPARQSDDDVNQLQQLQADQHDEHREDHVQAMQTDQSDNEDDPDATQTLESSQSQAVSL